MSQGHTQAMHSVTAISFPVICFARTTRQRRSPSSSLSCPWAYSSAVKPLRDIYFQDVTTSPSPAVFPFRQPSSFSLLRDLAVSMAKRIRLLTLGSCSGVFSSTTTPRGVPREHHVPTVSNIMQFETWPYFTAIQASCARNMPDLFWGGCLRPLFPSLLRAGSSSDRPELERRRTSGYLFYLPHCSSTVCPSNLFILWSRMIWHLILFFPERFSLPDTIIFYDAGAGGLLIIVDPESPNPPTETYPASRLQGHPPQASINLYL